MGLTKIRATQISNLDYKQAVRVITLTDITLSGGAPATVDSVSLITGDRVLVAGQSDPAQNGLYQVQTVGTGSDGTWVRTSDGNEDGEIQAGMVVMVTQGAVYADTPWKLTTNGEIIIGTTELIFEENYSLAFGNVFANGTAVVANVVSAPLTLDAGDNISITGNNTSKTVTIGVTGISLNSISNGTSNVNVVSSGGNVTVGVGGTNDIAVFSTAGIDVTGRVSASGNVTGGNLSTAGRLGVGTASPDYQVDITNTGQNALLVLRRTDGVGTFIEGQATRGAFGTIGADPLVLAYNSLAVISIGAGGAITVNPDGGSPFTLPTADGSANNILATDGAGNVDWTGTPTFTSLSVTGNITGGHILGNGAGLSGINVFANIAVTGETTVSANSISDTLTLAEGSGIAITTDAANNTITIGSVPTDSIFATGGDMGLITEAVTVSEDLGLITDAATIEYDLGGITTGGVITPDALFLPSKTVAELANLEANPAGQFVYCSDESGGSIPAFSDGTNWRRVTDRAVVT